MSTQEASSSDSLTFAQWARVCQQIKRTPLAADKKRLLSQHFASLAIARPPQAHQPVERSHQDLFLSCSFFLIQRDPRVFHLGARALFKHLIRMYLLWRRRDQLDTHATHSGDVAATVVHSAVPLRLCCTVDQLERHAMHCGDVATTVAHFFTPLESDEQQQRPVCLADVDACLSALHASAMHSDQAAALSSVFMRFTSADEAEWFVRLLLRDLKLGVAARAVLDALGAGAWQRFHASNDWRAEVERFIVAMNRSSSRYEDAVSAFEASSVAPNGTKTDADVSLFRPVFPMLALAVGSAEEAIERTAGAPLIAELKYDGERVQAHKRGTEVQVFSRSRKPVREEKLGDSLLQLLRDADTPPMILDAELVLEDATSGRALPFGSLGVRQREQYAHAAPCLRVFDLLWFDGRSLLHEPLSTRRALLRAHLPIVPHRIELGETVAEHIRDADSLLRVFDRVTAERGEEGVIVKALNSIYEPHARRWLKMKRDYIHSLRDSLDLVVLGAWNGKGARSGVLGAFLMGALNTSTQLWESVCRVGSGFTQAQLAEVDRSLRPNLMPLRETDSLPAWLTPSLHRTLRPQWIVRDPLRAPVWEITGAEYSRSPIHNSFGVSVRFPRVVRFRDDKTAAEHTPLAGIVQAAQLSFARRGGQPPRAVFAQQPRRTMSTRTLPSRQHSVRMFSSPRSHFSHVFKCRLLF